MTGTAPAFQKSAAKTNGFSEAAIYAVATWWADQLPGAANALLPTDKKNIDGPGNLAAEMIKAAGRKRISVTRDQYFSFRDTLAEILMQQKPKENPRGMTSPASLSLAIDYNPDENFMTALKTAGITDNPYVAQIYLPAKSHTYIHSDGRAFAPGEDGRLTELKYDGSPSMPMKSLAKLDFTGCPHFRAETRYFVMELQEGDHVVTLPLCDKPKTETAKTGQVLVITERYCEDFDMLNFNNAATAALHGAKWVSLQDKAEFLDGFIAETKIEKDDKGHYRARSQPFQAFLVTEAFATGHGGSDYKVVSAGDFVTKTVESNGYARYEVVRKDWVDSGRRWLACSADGTVTADKKVTSQEAADAVRQTQKQSSAAQPALTAGK